MNANNLPLSYEEELSQKVMILMTDGDNTMPASFASAYGFLSEGNLGTTDLGDAEDALDARLTTICSAMKAEGIIIYSIGFGDEMDGALRHLLRNCASANDYFFDARTSADLTTAFHTIGDALSKLRVSR